MRATSTPSGTSPDTLTSVLLGARILRNERQVAVALVDIEAVADDELGWNAEPDVFQIGFDLLQPFFDEQRAHFERRGTARLQVLAQVRERQSGVDDVFDDQHVPVGEIEVEVFHDAYDAARARRRSV